MVSLTEYPRNLALVGVNPLDGCVYGVSLAGMKSGKLIVFKTDPARNLDAKFHEVECLQLPLPAPHMLYGVLVQSFNTDGTKLAVFGNFFCTNGTGNIYLLTVRDLVRKRLDIYWLDAEQFVDDSLQFLLNNGGFCRQLLCVKEEGEDTFILTHRGRTATWAGPANRWFRMKVDPAQCRLNLEVILEAPVEFRVELGAIVDDHIVAFHKDDIGLMCCAPWKGSRPDPTKFNTKRINAISEASAVPRGRLQGFEYFLGWVSGRLYAFHPRRPLLELVGNETGNFEWRHIPLSADTQAHLNGDYSAMQRRSDFPMPLVVGGSNGLLHALVYEDDSTLRPASEPMDVDNNNVNDNNNALQFLPAVHQANNALNNGGAPHIAQPIQERRAVLVRFRVNSKETLRDLCIRKIHVMARPSRVLQRCNDFELRRILGVPEIIVEQLRQPIIHL